MRKPFLVALTMCLLASPAAWGHFQVLVPSSDVVTSTEDRTVRFTLQFTHPMAGGPLMNMGTPREFGVLLRGEKHDLRSALEAGSIAGMRTFTASYTVERPGAHVFYVEPEPYYEAGEDTWIIHYTKVVVDGFGAWSGWDAAVGFPVEIRPLTRPYGLWTGNLFRGIVLKDGEPVPFAHIEVEYLNEGGAVTIPAPPFETQVIKAGANGEFAYAMPRAGWWGFAALVSGDEPMQNPDGEPADVEMGALMWVRAVDMSTD